MFPIYLGFRGGKGVATGAGVVAMLLPFPAAVALLIWLGCFCATRTISISSLAAAAGLCFVHVVHTPDPWTFPSGILTGFCLTAMALVFVRHRTNIARLLQGSENQLQESNMMLLITKTIHVLALGLWFGSTIFFTMTTLVIFKNFELLGSSETLRPTWLPADQLSQERGIQLAGIAVGPLFDWFFPLQGICGFLAWTTALGWTKHEPGKRIHRIRTGLLFFALLTVLAGWPLARHVGKLRLERYGGDPAIAEAAKTAFAQWHTYSLLLNFVTTLLVLFAMASAAQLPTRNFADRSF
jgi:hypothetical protein